MTSTRSLVVTLPPAALLLFVQDIPARWLLAAVLAHLSIVVTGGMVLTAILMRRLDEPWFGEAGAVGAWVGSAAAAVALVTGAVALGTLASSGALRYQPSLQYLQLLSALDIAWVTAATAIGIGWWRGRRWGLGAGWVLAAVCVWSIWTYLDVVGFAPDGGWLVDGAALGRYVLPFDMAAAVIAVTAMWIGARSRTRRGAHPGAAPEADAVAGQPSEAGPTVTPRQKAT